MSLRDGVKMTIYIYIYIYIFIFIFIYVTRRHRPVQKGHRRRRNRCSGDPIRTRCLRDGSTAATIVTH